MAKLPAKIGKYKVVEQIASGGMGAVYKAEHPTLSRFVIIKKLTLRGDASMRERFRREAQIMMDFTSDYLVNVYDHFREGSSYYIVLEYVDGPSLESLLRKERYLPEHVALRIFRSSCRALQYAHERGVVHRDIKPGNILISTDGHVKLVDFGIASIHGGQSEDSLTREGMTLGTPSYMPPEQYADSRSVDKRADIYAMGVMLYEMTTGKKPFPNSISADAIRRIQQGKYTKPRKHNPKISSSTQRLIRRCMRVKPERRFQSMDAVLAKLDSVFDRRVRVPDAQIIGDFLQGKRAELKKASRGKRLTGAVAAVLLLLIGGAGGWAYLNGYHYEYLYPDEYGALEVAVRLPRQGKLPEEAYVDARIFIDDNDAIPAVEGTRLRFRPDPEQETENSFVLRSQLVYLPSDTYRLKIMAEQDLIWRSFLLRPRSAQRENARTVEGRRVTVDAGPPPALPLSVGF
ncbi:MAG: protein kinase, partial [Spirochaetes bacterium]|nr:protein kinase [Spirochaetota bacterium]